MAPRLRIDSLVMQIKLSSCQTTETRGFVLLRGWNSRCRLLNDLGFTIEESARERSLLGAR